MMLFKDKTKSIAPTNIWIMFHSCYMYSHKTLFGCIKQFLFEYKQDKHLIG